MFGLVISINGEQVVTAGAEDWDLLHANIMAKRGGDAEENDYDLSISGLPIQLEKGKLEHIRWGRRKLKIGDVVSIALAEIASADPPIKRYRSDRDVQEDPFTDEEIRDLQWETYLELKKKFEGSANEG